jgi:hypothetical protein
MDDAATNQTKQWDSNPLPVSRKGKPAKHVASTTPESRAYTQACESTNGPEIDADLGRLIDAWPTLPAAIRAGILAMIDAAKRGE